MYFVGLDLAWGERNTTGIAVVADDGRLAHISAAQDDVSILARLQPYVGGDCVVAIDAPLVVTNPTGNRPCEAALNHDFRRFDAGTHPSNTSRPWFAGGPRGGRLATALDLDLDPQSASPRRAIEVYPHAATVALFGLDRTLKYKHKQGRDAAQLQSELLRLIGLIESLQAASPSLSVSDHPDWLTRRRDVELATRKFQLRRAEDPIDAVVCAYVALFATRRPGDVTVYGDPATGCIVTPCPAALPDASGP